MFTKPLTIKNKPLKNRFCMPPLVCFNWADENGYETESRAEHYGKRAHGGAGLIVVEATAINKEGRITPSQLGLWEDGHIKQFKQMATACHEAKSLVLVQLVHAGKEGTDLSFDTIQKIKEDFVHAAIRAQAAGLDGVEIHGAHGYLINQFSAPASNKREDAYGGSYENRIRFASEVVSEVKNAVGKDFIIGYRYGCNDPTLVEDIEFTKHLVQLGVDFLNVSAGIGFKGITAPEGFPFSPITYMGVAIQKHVPIPVACVFGIKRPEEARVLLEDYGVSMVAIGRGFLADPKWGLKAISGGDIDLCVECSGGCRFREDGHNCPYGLNRPFSS